MKIKYGRKISAEKKKLIAAISEITGAKSKYMGPPTMNYRIGDYVVDRNGDLVFEDSVDGKSLIAALKERGYEGAAEITTVVSQETLAVPQAFPLEPVSGFSMSLPRSKLPDDALERLTKILQSKRTLIKKALGVGDLPIEVGEEKITFPWFSAELEPDRVEAYTKFIAALGKMAREQKRVSAKEKSNPNEKYAFRCFLLRLGFIGDEYKKERRILLKNFEGSSAFRTQASADRAKEKMEARKAAETEIQALVAV